MILGSLTSGLGSAGILPGVVATISAVVPIIPTKPQVIANFTGLPNAAFTTTPSSGNWNNLIRAGHYTGRSGASKLQVALAAYKLQSSIGNPELLPSNGFTGEVALETSATTLFQWSGANTAPVAAGGLVLSDVLAQRVEADSYFYSRRATIVASDTDQIPLMDRILPEGQGTMFANANNLTGTGALPKGSGSVSCAVSMLLGVPDAPMASFCLVGDSIANGVGDSNTITTQGWFNRAAVSVNSHTLVFHRQTVPGFTLQNSNPAVLTRSSTLWPYFTDIVFQCITNDVSSRTLTQIQSDVNAMISYVRGLSGPYGKRPRIHMVTALPRCSSTDNFQTLAGQTPQTGFAAGGIRDQYNAWIKSLVGVTIDNVIDVAPAGQDPTDANRWLTNGTANYATVEGIHPQSVIHAAMATIATASLAPFEADPLKYVAPV